MFERHRYQRVIILQAVYFKLRFTLSYRDVEELMSIRGIKVDHSTIQRWVFKFSKEVEKNMHKRKKQVCDSWRMDETYIKVKGRDMYLYRAVDRYGNTVDFLLTRRRQKISAQKFFNKAIGNNGKPRIVNIDKSGSNSSAILTVNKRSLSIKKIKIRKGNDKTQIFGGGASNSDASYDKTQIFGGGQAASGGRDLSKTFISGMEETADGGAIQKARATRKITGWIVSYSIDPMGVDFRIYEGKNRIGKDPSLEITLATDNTISGTHAIILFRSGKWYLEDEMSANGTFLNGEELPPRNPVEIADNDIIKVGATEFKFKTAI